LCLREILKLRELGVIVVFTFMMGISGTKTVCCTLSENVVFS
jgi:hypothetical protein